MSNELADCLVLNTRMAARAITRRYESHLRGHGITAVQFSLLATVARNEQRSITEIADSLAMERTTASRNLDLLARKGIILADKAEGANRADIRLSDKGRALLSEILPMWRKAQEELRQKLGEDGLAETLATLRRLSTL